MGTLQTEVEIHVVDAKSPCHSLTLRLGVLSAIARLVTFPYYSPERAQ